MRSTPWGDRQNQIRTVRDGNGLMVDIADSGPGIRRSRSPTFSELFTTSP
jgi:C4-dicarboxylate-specific signal transduction histidine kinase